MPEFCTSKKNELRVRAKITLHFSIPSLGYLYPILNRKILEIPIAWGLLWLCDFGSNKANTNLGANSVKLFFANPKILMLRRLPEIIIAYQDLSSKSVPIWPVTLKDFV